MGIELQSPRQTPAGGVVEPEYEVALLLMLSSELRVVPWLDEEEDSRRSKSHSIELPAVWVDMMLST